MRLAGIDVGVLDVLRTDLAADHEGGNGEHEPSEDSDLPVACTPAAHAGRDVVRALEGGHVFVSSFAWLTYRASHRRELLNMRVAGVSRVWVPPARKGKAAGGAAAFEEGGVVFAELSGRQL